MGGKAAREGGDSDRSRPGGGKQGGLTPEGESPSFRRNMNEIEPCPCNKHGQNCFKIAVKEKARGIRSEGSAGRKLLLAKEFCFTRKSSYFFLSKKNSKTPIL